MAGNIEEIADKHPDRVARRHFSALFPFSDYLAKELVAGARHQGLRSHAPDRHRLARSRSSFCSTTSPRPTSRPLAKLEDGKFVALRLLRRHGGRGPRAPEGDPRGARHRSRTTRAPCASRRRSRSRRAKIDAEDPRGVAGPVVEFDGNIGLVIGAGGGSLTLTDAVRKHGGRPANYAAHRRQPEREEGASG